MLPTHFEYVFGADQATTTTNPHGDDLQRGNELYREGRLEEAVKAYSALLARQPNSAQARNNLASALADLGRHQAAIPHFEQALAIQPDFADAWYNLGNSLRHTKQFSQAVECYQRALRCNSEAPHVFNNLGLALSGLGNRAQAIAAFERALELHPEYPQALTNLGLELMEQGDLPAAIDAHTQAISLCPSYSVAFRNRALARMLQNEFPYAWDDYDRRWDCDDFLKPVLSAPLWMGEPLQGKSILLYSEQGLGDTLQFVRFCQVLEQQGARVTLAAPLRLLPLLRSCEGIAKLVSRTELDGDFSAEFDFHCPLLSVPRRLRTTDAELPGQVPYLHADADLIAHWCDRLNDCFSDCPRESLRVGICWQGSPRIKYDLKRSMAPEMFIPLSQVPGVQLISLQKAVSDDSQLFAQSNVRGLGSDLDAKAAFVDSAAVIMNLDLVISADTAIAHVAGGLGKPVWVLLPRVPDWRWQMDRADSPWYPTARLFRQPEIGNWPAVFEQVAQQLVALPASQVSR